MLPIHVACNNDASIAIIHLLVSAGSDVNCQDNHGNTPLHYLCSSNSSLEIVEYLISQGADLNLQNKANETPIFLATDNTVKIKIIRSLIEHGAKLDFVSQGGLNLIHYAAKHNVSPEIIQLLIDNGVDVNGRNTVLGNQPLHYACQWQVMTPLIECLIENNAEINSQNQNTPLHVACANKSRIDIIKLLIDNGAEIDARNKYQNTPLIEACQNDIELEVIQFLVESGADPNAVNNSGGTPLHQLCWIDASIELVEYIISVGGDIKAINSRGNTPLHVAAKFNGKPVLLKYFVKNLSDLHLKNNEEHTTFHECCSGILRGGVKINRLETLISLGSFAEVEKLTEESKKMLFYNKEVVEIFNWYSYISSEMVLLLERGEYADQIIETCDKYEIPVSNDVFLFRLGSQQLAQKAINFCKTKEKENVLLFLKWVYGGIIHENIEREKVHKMCIDLEIGDQFYDKLGTEGLLIDLEQAFEDEESKDFTIIVNQKRIKVHKFLLFARSNLFRSMFVSLQENNINEINEHSNKSVETMKVFIKSLYTDNVDLSSVKNVERIIVELPEAFDFYQIDEKSKVFNRMKIQISDLKDTKKNKKF
ncbi:ankyrin repeat protein [Anaeramoeba flamelloides]|uniref:Ankyrin repeat protein n=1 Tax=Anaeramoeba flamelloides TaxID=1746091 RepID=A0AAV7YPW8_9EUKA|nr:ankyrin repeat protein [Anaeramoeba flamelloides]